MEKRKIYIHISGIIKIIGLETREREHIKKTLSLPNPLWHKLNAMGSPAVYATPPVFKYWTEQGEALLMPRGVKKRLIDWLEKIGRQYEIEEDFVEKSL